MKDVIAAAGRFTAALEVGGYDYVIGGALALAKVRAPIDRRQVWIMSAEEVLLTKTVFGRNKDWVDLERLLAERQAKLDWVYIDGWLKRLFGANDPRPARLASLRRELT